MPVLLYEGDCRTFMRRIAPNSIDAVVTDPPYETGFMGRKWDRTGIAFDPQMWRLAYDVLKPGAHLVAFGGSRTYHRIACAIEDAGFEIRDSLMWIFGTGFPKSHNAERAIAMELCTLPGRHYSNAIPIKGARPNDHVCPSCAKSEQWDGFGTALKPGFEPIVLARKPLIGTVPQNVLAYGCGALNIDACRIGDDVITTHGSGCKLSRLKTGKSCGVGDYREHVGRWPANVLHDGSDEVLAAFAAFGERESRPGKTKARGASRNAYNAMPTGGDGPGYAGDTGTAARFFKECEPTSDELSFHYSAKASAADRAGSKHPTIKPLALIRWLSKLICPPGGTILDPFAGSGTTGQAATLEGFNAVMIENEAEYCADIRRRLRGAFANNKRTAA